MLSLRRLIACVVAAVLLAGTFSCMTLTPANALSYASVYSVDPDDGESDVSVSKIIKVKFDDDMTRSDVEDKDYVTLTKKNSSGTINVDLSYSSNNRTLSVTPRSSLDYDTKYELTISKSVENTDGDPLQREYYSNFTTEARGSSSSSNYIKYRSPDDGDTGVSLDTDVEVTFSQDMNSNSIKNSTFYLRKSGSSSNISASVTYSNNSSRIATLNPDSSLDSNTTYNVYLTSDIKTDNNGYIRSDDWQFKTGSSSTAGISSSEPRSNASSVSTGTDVRVVFRTNLNTSSIARSHIVFRNTTDDEDISFDFSTSGSKTIVVKPLYALERNKDYSVRFTSGIKYDNGEAIDQYTLRFSTGTSSSSSPASDSIYRRDPDDGDTGVNVNTDISVQFKQDMDTATMKESNILLEETDGGKQVYFDVDYNKSKRILTIEPRNNLKTDKDYTIILRDGIRDYNSNRIGEIKWYFSTRKDGSSSGSASASTVYVSDMNPKSGATGVSVTAPIKLVFSGALDDSSLTSDSLILQKAATGETIMTGHDYKMANHSLSLLLLNPLARNAAYTVTLNGIKDSRGCSLSFLQYSFTTGISGGTSMGSASRHGTSANPLLTFNGNFVDMVDAQPYIKNKRTMVPMRVLFEMMGATVAWDNATQKITGTLGNKQVVMNVGKNVGSIDGKAVKLDAAPEIKAGRTMIPLRFATEALGLNVGYDSSNNIVQLSQ